MGYQSWVALPDLDAEKMQQVYLNMYNGEKYSHLLPKKEIPGEKQSFFATLKSFFSGSKSQVTLVNEQLMIENQMTNMFKKSWRP